MEASLAPNGSASAFEGVEAKEVPAEGLDCLWSHQKHKFRHTSCGRYHQSSAQIHLIELGQGELEGSRRTFLFLKCAFHFRPC